MSIDRGPASGSPLSVLSTGARALARGADLDATLGAVLGAAIDAVGASSGAVFLQDPDRPGLTLAGAIGVADADLPGLQAAAADPSSPVTATARSRTAAFAPGRTDLPLSVSREGVELTQGVVSFTWLDVSTPGDTARALVQAAADLIAVAVDRARLTSLANERAEWFERMAHTDPLTGLANGRTLARILELELARAARQSGEVSIAIFDVDEFGAAIAAGGHEAGDDILRAVAAVLAGAVRLVDTVARYRADAFVLVAPGPAGLTVARRVVDGIAALDPVAGRQVTVSAGVARFPADGGSAEELIAAAEAALEQARAGGRGRIASAAVSAAG